MGNKITCSLSYILETRDIWHQMLSRWLYCVPLAGGEEACIGGVIWLPGNSEKRPPTATQEIRQSSHMWQHLKWQSKSREKNKKRNPRKILNINSIWIIITFGKKRFSKQHKESSGDLKPSVHFLIRILNILADVTYENWGFTWTRSSIGSR